MCIYIYIYIYTAVCVCPTHSIPPKQTNNLNNIDLNLIHILVLNTSAMNKISPKRSRDHHMTRRQHMATTQYWNSKKKNVKKKKTTTLCFKISHCVGTPGQTLPQPSEVPPPTLPHVQKQTRVPLAAWIRVWDLSRSTAPSPYDPYGLIQNWPVKKAEAKQAFQSKTSWLQIGFLSITNLAVAACCCQEASQKLDS